MRLYRNIIPVVLFYFNVICISILILLLVFISNISGIFFDIVINFFSLPNDTHRAYTGKFIALISSLNRFLWNEIVILCERKKTKTKRGSKKQWKSCLGLYCIHLEGIEGINFNGIDYPKPSILFLLISSSNESSRLCTIFHKHIFKSQDNMVKTFTPLHPTQFHFDNAAPFTCGILCNVLYKKLFFFLLSF